MKTILQTEVPARQLQRDALALFLYPHVRRLVCRRSPRDADAVISDVMLAIILNAEKFDAERCPNPVFWAGFYIRKATHLAHRPRRETPFSDIGDDDRQFDPAERPAPAEEPEKLKTVTRVRAALRGVRRGDRKLLRQRFVLGRSSLQVAAKLGLGESAVSLHTRLALGRAREALEAHGFH